MRMEHGSIGDGLEAHSQCLKQFGTERKVKYKICRKAMMV